MRISVLVKLSLVIFFDMASKRDILEQNRMDLDELRDSNEEEFQH